VTGYAMKGGVEVDFWSGGVGGGAGLARSLSPYQST
jgi:hypothetical protein